MPVQSPGMIAMMGFVMGVRFRDLGDTAGPQRLCDWRGLSLNG
jgi:hypothetical protein